MRGFGNFHRGQEMDMDTRPTPKLKSEAEDRRCQVLHSLTSPCPDTPPSGVPESGDALVM